MAKFHVNPATGEPGACRALKGNCPFGSEEQHFTSASAARSAYEKAMPAKPTPLKKPVPYVMRSSNEVPHIYTEGHAAGPYARPEYNKLTADRMAERYNLSMETFHTYSYQPLEDDQKIPLSRLLEKAYNNVNDGSKASFETAEAMAEEFKKLAKDQTAFRYSAADGDEAVAETSFAYVSPRVYQVAKAFQDELESYGWVVRKPDSAPQEFTKLFVKAAKSAKSSNSITSLTKHMRNTLTEDGWVLEGPGDWHRELEREDITVDENLQEAATEAIAKVQKDRHLYEAELEALK
jgi:hypothetical protein